MNDVQKLETALSQMQRELLRLRDKISLLEEQKKQLEEALLPPDNPLVGVIKLTPQLRALLHLLYRKDFVSNAQLEAATALYGYSTRGDDTLASLCRAKVAICKLRKSVKPYGIDILTVTRQGYYMTPEGRAKLSRLITKDKTHGSH